ncbi:hypothetical protein EJ04DRAFT_559175 [Polyplosphaeria fusca]|uniref:Uncharacterized protein n=1 Tax=Polyplosphaeria fusca TaxID=682080 RepID=A0A9P4RAZ3_9PLEO|nr:hypothetical protein EJ04DRAFT_559175 [Polyplosphaeria fusca]
MLFLGEVSDILEPRTPVHIKTLISQMLDDEDTNYTPLTATSFVEHTPGAPELDTPCPKGSALKITNRDPEVWKDLEDGEKLSSSKSSENGNVEIVTKIAETLANPDGELVIGVSEIMDGDSIEVQERVESPSRFHARSKSVDPKERAARSSKRINNSILADVEKTLIEKIGGSSSLRKQLDPVTKRRSTGDATAPLKDSGLARLATEDEQMEPFEQQAKHLQSKEDVVSDEVARPEKKFRALLNSAPTVKRRSRAATLNVSRRSETRLVTNTEVILSSRGLNFSLPHKILECIIRNAIKGDLESYRLMKYIHATYLDGVKNADDLMNSLWTIRERTLLRKGFLVKNFKLAVQHDLVSEEVRQRVRMQFFPDVGDTRMDSRTFNTYIHEAVKFDCLNKLAAVQCLLLDTADGEGESDQMREIFDDLAGAASTPDELIVLLENYAMDNLTYQIGDQRYGALDDYQRRRPKKCLYNFLINGRISNDSSLDDLIDLTRHLEEQHRRYLRLASSKLADSTKCAENAPSPAPAALKASFE